jgi:hypothetical protein
MTPAEIRAISDPAAREHAARGQLGVAAELTVELAAIRRDAIRELHARLGSWRKVGELIGVSGQNAHKAAR